MSKNKKQHKKKRSPQAHAHKRLGVQRPLLEPNRNRVTAPRPLPHRVLWLAGGGLVLVLAILLALWLWWPAQAAPAGGSAPEPVVTDAPTPTAEPTLAPAPLAEPTAEPSVSATPALSPAPTVRPAPVASPAPMPSQAPQALTEQEFWQQAQALVEAAPKAGLIKIEAGGFNTMPRAVLNALFGRDVNLLVVQQGQSDLIINGLNMYRYTQKENYPLADLHKAYQGFVLENSTAPVDKPLFDLTA